MNATRHLFRSAASRASSKSRMSKTRKLAYAVGGATGLYYIDRDYNARTFQRNLFTVYNGIIITYEYKINFREGADIAAIHQRVAERILKTCQQNGGLYIKFGQSVASMNHILPVQYNDSLKSLFMEAPTIAYAEVEKLFRQEFKCRPDELFRRFDPVPVASASIAQVHRATTLDGTEVAVKIQKPAIRRQLDWDMFVYRMILRVFEYAFELPIAWSADYTEDHLRREVDFNNEAKNSERCMREFSSSDSGLGDSVYVPKVYWDLTSERILTTEWIDGIPMANPDALEKAGFSLEDVMNKVVNAFSFQLFHSGFVHADPHVGNILVRKHPSKKTAQVVVLDHGLYVEESPKFRQDYCRFWKAMFLMDNQVMEEICKGWGIEDVSIFASATLQRPYNSKKAQHLGTQVLSQEDIYRMQLVTKDRIKRFLSDTEKIPRELIFVGRNLNLVRSNNKQLGSPVNRINIMSSWAVRGLGNSEWLDPAKPHFHSPVIDRLAVRLDHFIFQSRLFIISISFYATRFTQKFVRWLTGVKILGFEDILENQMNAGLQTKLGITVNASTFDA